MPEPLTSKELHARITKTKEELADAVAREQAYEGPDDLEHFQLTLTVAFLTARLRNLRTRQQSLVWRLERECAAQE